MRTLIHAWLVVMTLMFLVMLFIPTTWSFLATASVLFMIALGPSVLFANKMQYGGYLTFPWSKKKV